MTQPLLQVLLVAFGSALGGVTRWTVNSAVGQWFGTAFPYGTLIINVSGCFLLGWLLSYLNNCPSDFSIAWLGREELRLAIAVGFTGSFTTFSTFEWESNALLQDQQVWKASAYMLGSIALGLLALRIGMMVSVMHKT